MASRTAARGTLLMAGLVSVFAFAEDLILTEDTVIDVAEGVTNAYDKLGGGPYSLTKIGSGTILFSEIANAQARITVAGGIFATAEPVLPACAATAVFHVDGSATNTMTLVSEGGTNFIDRVNDVRPGNSRYAWYNAQTLLAVAAGGNRTETSSYADTHRPYVGITRQNTRTFIDFGSFLTEVDRAGSIAYGWGGVLDWSSACDSIRGVYMVFADTPDIATVCNARTRGPFFLSHSNGSSYDFHRGVPNTTVGVPKMFDKSSVTEKVYKGTNYLNGALVTKDDNPVPPPGFNVLTLNTIANAKANTFCRNGTYRYGGQRLAECLVFDRVPTAEEHVALSRYLTMKWTEAPVASLTLAAGAKLDLRGQGIKAAFLDVTGRAELANGSLRTAAISATCSNLVVKAGEVSLGYEAASSAMPSIESAGAVAVAAEHEARMRAVVGAGALVKTAGGRLTVNTLSGIGAIDVQGGELRVSPAETDLAYFHVDAAATNTMTVVSADGTNYVERWNDALGNGLHADYDTTSSTSISWNDNKRVVRKPFLDNEDGRPVMNFGSYLSQNAEKNSSFAGYGAGMNWSQGSTNLCEMFLFLADTEDVEAQASGGSGRSQFLLGDPKHYDFHRGYDRKLLDRRNDNEPLYYGRRLADGEILVDGRTVDYSSVLPGGLHLVELRTKDELPVRAGAFARDRGYRWGGQRLAECLVFTNRIDGALRARLREHLLAKWHGSNFVAGVFGSLKVGPKAALAFPYAAVETAALELAGRLDAERIAVSALTAKSAAEVTGMLTLADGAAVTVAAMDGELAAVKAGALSLAGGGTLALGLGRGQAGRAVRVVETSSITGDLTDWTASLTGATNRVRLETRADGLYAIVLARGITLSIR